MLVEILGEKPVYYSHQSIETVKSHPPPENRLLVSNNKYRLCNHAG